MSLAILNKLNSTAYTVLLEVFEYQDNIAVLFYRVQKIFYLTNYSPTIAIALTGEPSPSVIFNGNALNIKLNDFM